MMSSRLVLLGLVLIQCAHGAILYKETFDSTWGDRWTHSSAKSDYAKFKLTAGKWYGDKEADKGIQTPDDARFYSISTNFPAFSNKDKPLVLQMSVKHEQNIDCGGAYIKVGPKWDVKKFDGDTKYNIMFGPDVCGATKKIHFIFEYKGKNLLWKKEPRCETDQLTHVYTAIINTDGTYEVLVDNVKKESGRLEDDWDFLAPKTIPDADDKKPSDWVDEAEMVDPEDKKPADFDDQPESIADPDAKQPEDWDEEEDGKWEAPMIANPKFTGEWKPKKIPNPKYKGAWKAKEIPNPAYEPDEHVGKYAEFGAAGIEIWQVKAGTIFDNIILTDSVAEAKTFYDETFGKSKDAEKKMFDKIEEDKRTKEEEERKKREEEEKKNAAEDADDEDDDDDEDEKKSDDKAAHDEL